MDDLATRLGTEVKSGALPLLEAFHELQEKHGWLPRESLADLGRAAQKSLEELHSCASFYKNLALAPRAGKLVRRVCTGLPCRLAGAATFLANARAAAADRPGEVCVEEVPCLGQCDGAPAALSGWDVVRARDEDLAPDPAETRVILEGIERGPSLAAYLAGGGYKALERWALENDPAAICAVLRTAGLRGMGGAGFPTGMKWDAVRKASGDRKYVVVNADEGEPGTFKDRVILERLPHRLLEGVFLACLATGAQEAWIYIRDEYRPARQALLRALDELASSTSEIGIPPPPVRLCRGAGSYVCGEESALLESLEGKRGEPRLRPPFPAEKGLFGKPTAINNVETLAAAAQVLARDGRTADTKLISLSGAVRRPGVYELRLGTPVRTLVEQCGGGVPPAPDGRPRAVKAFFTAGLAAGFLPASALDLPIAFDALQKAGAALGCASFIVIPAGECIVAVVEEALAFFAHESCGKCTPCRAGTEKMTHMLRGWRDPAFGATGRGADEVRLLEELAPAIVDASICGLGQFAPKPWQDALRHFRDEVEGHARGECLEGACF